MSQPNNNDFFTHMLNNPMPSPNHSSSNQASNSSPSQTSFSQQQQFVPSQQLPFQQQLQFVQPQTLPFQQQLQFQNMTPYYTQPQFPIPQQQFFSQSQQQQLPYIPQPLTQPMVESVPETQPETEKQKSKRKGKAKVGEGSEKPKTKRQLMPWTAEEEVILAERWLDATENPKIGTNQSADSFWATVVSNYNQVADRKRNNDQITGKWTKMSREIRVFSGIYNQLSKNWPSGSNDADIIEAARDEYHKRQSGQFSHYKPWQILKNCPKFYVPEGIMTSRRRPIPEAPITLGDDQPLRVDPNPDHTTLFGEDAIRRPPGRLAGRKSRKSSASSDAASSCSSEEVRSQMFEAQKEIAKTQKQKRQSSLMKLMNRAFRIVNTSVNPDLPTEDQEILQKYRQKMKTILLTDEGPEEQQNEDEDDDTTPLE